MSNILINKSQIKIFSLPKIKIIISDHLARELKIRCHKSHNNYIGGRYSVLSEVGMVTSQV